MYEVITITNKRVITERLQSKSTAETLFAIARFGYPEGEKVEKIYLTHNNHIMSVQIYKNK